MPHHLFALTVAALLFAAATPAVLKPPAPEVLANQAYGADARQRLDFQGAALRTPAPVIVYIHGGGWSAGGKGSAKVKPAHFAAKGYAFAAINHRFVPQATVEQQAADVAAAIAWLRANARQLRIDPDRVVLMAHSSGAHLAALIATDPRWLGQAKVPFAALRAAVLIDGAGYDVPAQIAGGGTVIDRYFIPAFGRDPARQAALSPSTHVGDPDAPAWLFVQDAANPYQAGWAARFAAALRGAGADVEMSNVTGTTHMRIDGDLGLEGDFATGAVDAFLAARVPVD